MLNMCNSRRTNANKDVTEKPKVQIERISTKLKLSYLLINDLMLSHKPRPNTQERTNVQIVKNKTLPIMKTLSSGYPEKIVGIIYIVESSNIIRDNLMPFGNFDERTIKPGFRKNGNVECRK